MRAAIAGLGLIVAGCAAPRYEEGKWPAGMPPREFYTKAYEADPRNQERQKLDEYFSSVIKFYQGAGLIPGWEKLSRDFLSDLSHDDYLALSPKFAYAGQLISAEYAKDARVRRITMRELQIWAGALGRAKSRGAVRETADRVLEDVEAILEGRLDARAVTVRRYGSPAAS